MDRRTDLRICALTAALSVCCCSPSPLHMEGQLAISTDLPNAQIEVGGPFVGIEAHRSSPLVTRVSFFYPVANSLDNSQDYWSRDSARVFLIGVRAGSGPVQVLEGPSITYSLTPYSVTFRQETTTWRAAVTYEFCLNQPAMVVTITVTNRLPHADTCEVRTHLDAALRTSHTYERKDRAWTEHLPEEHALLVHYPDAEAGHAELFVINAGIQPHSFTTDADDLAKAVSGHPRAWLTSLKSLPGHLLSAAQPGAPVIAFLYRAYVGPRDSLTVRQIVGMCTAGEARSLAPTLRQTYAQEVASFRHFVLGKAFLESELDIDDTHTLHSARWAKAVLAANAHHLAGQIVPMPCPAEYNFFFTHDALMTDMAACMFDPARVRRDLRYLAALADSLRTLPHAYYWKDSTYATEYAGADNWNHLWFIIVSSRFLRHSGDRETVATLQPLLRRSLHLALTHLREDDLIWAYRPDWWDIGSSYGPRTYMSVLVAAALREYQYLSWALGDKDSLCFYEALAKRIGKAVSKRLWDEKRGYLTNYLADGRLDTHYYIGSLLAVPFGVLEPDRARRLVETARSQLVDPWIGVLNVQPPDFDELAHELHFQGNEAGSPYRYLNGGVWPHGNAWYILALNNTGAKQEAYQFLCRTMNLHGVMTSPNGQPAMYEYRCSDARDPSQYGRVDKPQFLWAAGWYLHALFSIYGLTENEWNLCIEPFLPKGQRRFAADWFVAGSKVRVTIRGHGPLARQIQMDGRRYPSLVIPHDDPPRKRVDVELGPPSCPYVASASSALRSARLGKNSPRLELRLAAFPGHESSVVVISPWPVAEVSAGANPTLQWQATRLEAAFRVEVTFTHQQAEEQVTLHLKGSGQE